jgi:hypothetical protein
MVHQRGVDETTPAAVVYDHVFQVRSQSALSRRYGDEKRNEDRTIAVHARP